MKRLVSMAFVFIMVLVFSTTAFAEISTYSKGSDLGSNNLTISGSSAICKSIYKDNDSSIVKVVITQSLEKQGFLWIWSKAAGEWSKTSNGSSVTLTNTVSGLAKGTYRVKTVFTVTDKYGETETVTIYSPTQKCG